MLRPTLQASEKSTKLERAYLQLENFKIVANTFANTIANTISNSSGVAATSVPSNTASENFL